jgi:hypothetical protein
VHRQEGDVLDSDVVVAMLAPIGGTQAELLAAEVEVDDLLGTSVTRIATVLGEAQWPEETGVEVDRPCDVADRQIDMMDPTSGQVNLLGPGVLALRALSHTHRHDSIRE